MSDGKQLFLDALDLPAADRRAYVEGAAGADTALRDRVLRLIEAHERAELDAPEPPQHPTEDQSGDRIGAYKLLQEIGTGGFGTVFMAEQFEPVRRKVALKIIKLGMDTKQVIARFEAERQALAMMDHPNIAKIFDAGATASGRPYFVMELVKGIPITEYCDQENLTTQERLELFQQVCHAVQHAHQKGIIHRDLKPSNLLVTLHDGKPVPKVIDFGIAKATDHRLTEKTLFTEFRQIVGTPEYMSPEQAELSGLDVDIRSDVYSLGVLLYELLTGTKPFDLKSLLEKGFEEILRVIREVDPPRPSTRISTMGDAATGVAKHRRTAPRLLNRLVTGDLDWIVMKALEKDRARRYGTASALAADLGRFLVDQPVEARPPSAWYRTRKFAKRHRLGVAAAAIVFLALCTGLSVAALGWREARVREREARTEATRANTVVAMVEKMLRAADPHQTKGVNFTVRELLDEFDHEFRDQLAGEPEVEASVRSLIGNAYLGLGLPDKAAAQLGAALSLRRRTGSPQLYQSAVDWAWLLHDQGKYEEAADEMRRRLAEGRGRDLALVNVLHGLADNLQHLQRWDEAERFAREALDLSPAGSRDAAESLYVLAVLLGKRGDLRGAEALFRESLALQERIVPGSLRVSAVLNGLAVVLQDQGRHAEAEQLLRKAIDMQMRIHGREEPITLTNLAVSLRSLDRLKEAEEADRRALEIARRTLGEGHPNVSYCARCLGDTVARMGRSEEAEGLYRQAITLARATHRGDHENVADALGGHAQALLALGRYAEAEAPCRESLAMNFRLFGEQHTKVMCALENLASLLREQGKYREAAETSRKALAMARTLIGDAHADTATQLNQLGLILVHLNEPAEAERCHREALAIRRAAFGTGHSSVAISLCNLALALEQLERKDEAEQCHREGLEVLRRAYGESHPSVATALNNLGKLEGDRGRWAEAEGWYRQALAVAEKLHGGDHAKTAVTRMNLGSTLLDAGDPARAQPLLRGAYADLAKSRGELHPITIRCAIFLGNALMGTHPSDAVPILEKARAGSEETLGPAHDMTQHAAHALGFALLASGRAEDARKCFELALDGWRRATSRDPIWGRRGADVLIGIHMGSNRPADAEPLFNGMLGGELGTAGRKDPDAHGWLAGLGLCLLMQNRPAESEPVLRECLELRRTALPEGDWLTFNSMSMLGESLTKQGKHAEAEPLLIASYEQMKPPDELAFRKPEALARIVQLYEAWGKTAEAAAWRAKGP